jgi:lysozyme family protein
MPTDARAYIAAVVAREGGYSNNPADRGGRTRWGVTEAVARAYGYTGGMTDLPLATATDILLKRYWIEPRFNELDAIDPKIAEKLLDIGVNFGQVWGVRWMQRALNVLNKEASLWPDLTVDGRLGSLSFYALKTYLAQRGADGSDVLLDMIRAQQTVRYIEIAEGDPSQETHEFGWQRRAQAVT